MEMTLTMRKNATTVCRFSSVSLNMMGMCAMMASSCSFLLKNDKRSKRENELSVIENLSSGQQ